MTRTLLLTGFFLFLGACSATDHAEEKFHEVKIDEVPADIKISSALWDQLEGKEGAAGHGEADPHEDAGHGKPAESADAHGAPPADAHGASAEGAIEDDGQGGIMFMPVNVILREKNPGVLSQPLIRITFPRGGGVVDFATYVTGKAGSFFVQFEWPETETPEEVKIWFDSKSRRRKLDDGFWGMGCGKFANISRGFRTQSLPEGFKVNTTRDRHLTVLGGHFVFALKTAKESFVAQVTFKDSRKPILFCQEL